MSPLSRAITPVAASLLAPLVLGCHSKVLNFEHTGDLPAEDCRASADWLTATSLPDLAMPAPHPAGECPFYEMAVQQFLIAARPQDATGEPAFAAYPGVDDLYDHSPPLPAGALAPAGAHRGTALRAWLGNVKQAGLREILIDRNGHAIFYGTHVNDEMAAFINRFGLRTSSAIQDADPMLQLPPGVVELQSAWQDIDPADGVSGDYSRFITTSAWVATLHRDPSTGSVSVDRDHPREIRVALLELHVAFTLPGHPEQILSTFEHVDGAGLPDVTPSSPRNEAPTSPGFGDAGLPAVSDRDFPLYQAGTGYDDANRSVLERDMTLDEATQSFAQRTSIYRVFPGGRSNSSAPHPAVTSLNANLGSIWAGAGSSAADPRAHYRLVGAEWLDKPAAFTTGSALQNDVNSPFVSGPHIDQSGHLVPAVSLETFTESIVADGTISPYSIVGGQDRLAGVAIESFNQSPGNFNNCLSCHNTTGVNVNGVDPTRQFGAMPIALSPKMINVSHIFASIVLEDCGATGLCPAVYQP